MYYMVVCKVYITVHVFVYIVHSCKYLLVQQGDYKDFSIEQLTVSVSIV